MTEPKEEDMNQRIRQSLTDDGKKAKRQTLRDGFFGKPKDDDKEGDDNA
jgi:hypothetical protein